jgi:hypothetical protein
MLVTPLLSVFALSRMLLRSGGKTRLKRELLSQARLSLALCWVCVPITYTMITVCMILDVPSWAEAAAAAEEERLNLGWLSCQQTILDRFIVLCFNRDRSFTHGGYCFESLRGVYSIQNAAVRFIGLSRRARAEGDKLDLCRLGLGERSLRTPQNTYVICIRHVCTLGHFNNGKAGLHA